MPALRAAALYFALVFLLGFALGSVRVLLVIPHLGESLAVLLELPVMLALSWWVCAYVLRRVRVPTDSASRLLMGGSALLLLLLAEFVLSVWVFGRTPAEHYASYRSLAAQLGLIAQIAYGCFPLLQRRRH